MKYGLSDSEFQFLSEKVIQPLKLHKAQVYLFGSRANGKFQKFSDVDLLYVPNESHPVPTKIITQILISLEESDFAYKVDLVNNSELALSYYASVDQDKIEL